MQRRIPVCPRCGSTNISFVTTSYIVGVSDGTKRRCEDCGFEGMMPEIEEKGVQSFRKQLKSHKNK